MTYWRVTSAARSTRLAIEGQYLGATGYLIGGSPQLLSLDLRLLKLPGIWTMAINNAAVVFEPDAFIALDSAHCFNFNIINSPRVLKFFNYSRSTEVVSGKKLCHYPNTLFFDLDQDDNMMMSEFCRISGPLPYWRNTFFTALACMYQLGFKKVYLIGCTFDTSKGAYSHDSRISQLDIDHNQEFYNDTVDKIKQLFPMLSDEGLDIYTCHEDTALDGIVPHCSFEKSISSVVTECTSIEFNYYKHSSGQ